MKKDEKKESGRRKRTIRKGGEAHRCEGDSTSTDLSKKKQLINHRGAKGGRKRGILSMREIPRGKGASSLEEKEKPLILYQCLLKRSTGRARMEGLKRGNQEHIREAWGEKGRSSRIKKEQVALQVRRKKNALWNRKKGALVTVGEEKKRTSEGRGAMHSMEIPTLGGAPSLEKEGVLEIRTKTEDREGRNRGPYLPEKNTAFHFLEVALEFTSKEQRTRRGQKRTIQKKR